VAVVRGRLWIVHPTSGHDAAVWRKGHTGIPEWIAVPAARVDFLHLGRVEDPGDRTRQVGHGLPIRQVGKRFSPTTSMPIIARALFTRGHIEHAKALPASWLAQSNRQRFSIRGEVSVAVRK
jgi:hypothetical protein